MCDLNDNSKMPKYPIFIFALILLKSATIKCGDVLGCGGFIKSHVQIDFSKIDIELITKQGIVKDKTSCAPNNGYYFIPVYDKGEYTLKLKPPPGWSFTPTTVGLVIDGTSNLCSQGTDINFVFKGFGITGKVENYKDPTNGPAGVKVLLKSTKIPSEVREVATTNGGSFFFTPVYPGSYVVSISNKQWKILQDSVIVQVAEGNTELPSGSLIIAGYPVSGFVKSEKRPVQNVNVILYQKENKIPVYVEGCNKETFQKVQSPAKQVCHVTTDEQGSFSFPTVSPGSYFVVPYFNGPNTHFQPGQLDVLVESGDVLLGDSFEIVGFSVTGKVLSSKLGKPLKGAKISLNNKEVAVTKDDGVFVLQKVKANSYNLRVSAEQVEFEDTTIKIDLETSTLNDLYPSKYEVCGKVLSDSPRTIVIQAVDSGETYTTTSSPSNGKFCYFLVPRKYKLHVSVEDQKGHIQFFPISQSIDVVSNPISKLTFSQLKAIVKGKVVCLREKDCKSLQVTLRSLNEDVTTRSEDIIVGVVENIYTFNDIRPGSYEVVLSDSNLCWETSKHIISINSATETVQPFIHSGYPVNFVSSHAAQVNYKLVSGTSSPGFIKIAKGATSHCLKKSGVYEFSLSSCHTYEKSTITFDTNSQKNEINIKAIKHSMTLSITAETHNISSIYVDIVYENGTRSHEGPLTFKNNKYTFTIMLGPNEFAELTPRSDTLYFKPKTFTLNGQNDCADLGIVFIAAKGRVFQGNIIPPLAGVIITVESESEEILSIETNAEGKYKFLPLDDSKAYKIGAKKDSYVLVGPNKAGDFVAQKLASVIVTVLDDTDEMPLQGALLSLSGDASYRSNLQTDKNGKITFNSLNPSQYFLRPMMKEYNFNPSSKIIDVQEGTTVSVKLRGSRVAYSAFGQITSLNGEPEDGIVIVAEGQGNCSHFSEDSISEPTGRFRVRGLHPHCLYKISVKGNYEVVRPIERAVPPQVNLQINKQHHRNLKFMVFRPTLNTDVMVRVFTSNIANYKQLKVKLIRESSPSSLIYVTKLDTSNNHKMTEDSSNFGIVLQFTSVPLDGKNYSIQLESVSPSRNSNIMSRHFVANSSYKFIDLTYSSTETVSEQNIKQSSVWALFVIFATFVSLYNVQELAQFLRGNYEKFNFGTLTSKFGFNNYRKKSGGNDYAIDKNEIEQIVQSINAPKRKLKMRKT